ncbi:hypothetical protein GALL_298820 [mine drainage metagenome]|uniref:DUF2946 domain-containing protein n=1 Tax=mine drainage metagenome TaxID=410659 RepID=A0A1J5QX08_9ZZZZ
MTLARTWRGWILGWALLTVVGIQIIESTHHHESKLLQNKCAVCQFVAHQPIDLLPAIAAPMAATLLLLFVLPYRRHAVPFAEPDCTGYDSRAPPCLTA